MLRAPAAGRPGRPLAHAQRPRPAPARRSSTLAPPATPPPGAASRSADQGEVAKFDRLAARWWDGDGPMAALHDMNGLRVRFIAEEAGPVGGRRVLDVGCGAGLLAESLARLGARVTAIDAAPLNVQAARRHAALEPGLAARLRYLCVPLEALAAQERAQGFELVTCLEVLEHLPPPALPAFVGHLCSLVAPGGCLVLSTISRTPRAFLETVLAAEHLLRLVPPGTHDWRRFLAPARLADLLRAAAPAVRVQRLQGLAYNPWTRRWRTTAGTDANYLLAARVPQ